MEIPVDRPRTGDTLGGAPPGGASRPRVSHGGLSQGGLSHSGDERSLGSFASLRGRHLLDRLTPFEQWRRPHAEQGVWGYHQQTLSHPFTPRARTRDEFGDEGSGVNLLTQDYLALSSHPAVHEAITAALRDHGPHSGGSPAAAGDTPLAEELCGQLAELTGMRHVVLFPTGWAAGFGAVNALARRFDHIVVDELVHACVHEGVAAGRSTRITRTPHLDHGAVHRALRRIRAEDAANGILVITESLFSMNSDTPDLAALQRTCHEYDAVLLVDQAHDIGVLGPGGRGQAAGQGMHGRLDVVVGSMSKAFATNGGYLATNSSSVAAYVRYFASTHMFSSALTPLQTAGALAAARIMRSDEGQRLRDELLRNAGVLRRELARTASGPAPYTVLGVPSPIVPVEIDSLAVGRAAMGVARRDGVLLHLVEFPVVPRGRARYRLQLSSAHRPEDLALAARVIREAVASARADTTTRPEDSPVKRR
ncbi:8-amino-7-oxononanoate synthase (plasmid) [Streptomyces clavuligerus]|nr:pyridoxal phosphate-dependent aminotransferase family protein [Streptomyces clavuligerus]QCS09985.1 8-amino-7-oxononanoate synthase [Streptomyces clavuligerus]QPJ97972.1 aminotransferase class I/II-fold pyridoxal phosphate-dependent enzyme [Streptomyces clavuligerus]